MTPATESFPISPLTIDQMATCWWGQYDPLVIDQLAPLADEPCYRPKFYKAPGTALEIVPAYSFVSMGLKITPGSIIYGFYLPTVPPNTSNAAHAFNLQITDVSLQHTWYDEPIPSLFVSNSKPTYSSAVTLENGSFPNLLPAPYAVVGSGLLMVEIWETSGSQQRIQLVFGVLEVVG